MQPIILCGGLGKRLWPLSTKDLPKQFLRLGSNLSFFQKTLIRLNFYDNPIIIGSYLHKDLIYHQMKEVGIDGLVVLEEKVTGTYLPILFGIILSSYLGKNKVGIFPTDHFIKDEHYFLYNINQAIELSNSNKIVTFGQKADFFNKNYGHIIAINKYENIYLCNKFIEKPQNIDLNFHLRQCFWNLGIFIFKTDLLNNLFQNDYKIIQFYLKNIDITKDFTIKKNI